MDAEHLRRRMERRRNMKPKSLGEVLKPLATAQFNASPNSLVLGEPPMKARSLRFRGRTIVVGRTPFVFDSDGLCVHTSRGRVSDVTDFQALLKLPGVEAADEKAAPPPPPAPPPSRGTEPTVKVEPIVVPPEAVPASIAHAPTEEVQPPVQAAEEDESSAESPKPVTRRRRVHKVETPTEE